MARGNDASRATRVAGGVSLFAGLASAAALTGAAFFTVQQVSCGDEGRYIRHDNHVEFVGGCFEPEDVPGNKGRGPAEAPAVVDDDGAYQK